MNSSSTTTKTAPWELSQDRMEEMNSLRDNIEEIHGKIRKSTAYIPKVPQEIREQNTSAYTPRLVSIGPLHILSMDEHLQSHMENIKRSYVYELLVHVAKQLKEVDAQQLAKKLEGLLQAEKLKGFKDADAMGLAKQLKDGDEKKLQQLLLSICMEQMEKFWIEKAKSYYPAEANQAVTKEMLVIDGCFIIRLLHKYCVSRKKEEDTVSPGGAIDGCSISRLLHKCVRGIKDVGCQELCEGTQLHMAVMRPMPREEDMLSPSGAASSSSLQTPSSTFDPILDHPKDEGCQDPCDETGLAVRVVRGSAMVVQPMPREEDMVSAGGAASSSSQQTPSSTFGAILGHPKDVGCQEPCEETRLAVVKGSAMVVQPMPREEDMVSPTGAAASSQQTPSSTFDPIFHYPMRLVSVFRDLLLLENQLPFFVLDNLFCLTLGLLPDGKHSLLRRYILDCFCQTLRIGSNCTKPEDQHSIDVEEEDKRRREYAHLLHVLHEHYPARWPSLNKKRADVPPPIEKRADFRSPIEKKANDGGKFTPSASVLDRAAVEFRVPEDKFTVQFVHQRWGCNGARFEIPTLSIDDNTEAVFRNFIAFEQCSPGGIRGYFITSYAFLMDKLVNTEADAQVLEEAKVIENYLGSRKDVPLLFDKLCKEVSLDDRDNLFLQVCKEATKYNKHHLSAWLLVIGQYVHRRWSATPYTFIAFVVAFLVFAMQVEGFIISLTRR